MDQNRSSAAHAASPVVPSGNGILNTILSVLLILTSLAILAYLGTRLISGNGSGRAVKSKQYQALFLTNGQVYFGHLKNVDASYVKMTDIFYLQVQQQVQPKDNSAAAAGQQPQVSLAKLGSELHGPEDSMYVSREQVLFWENLKDDGKVTTAVKDYKAGKK